MTAIDASGKNNGHKTSWKSSEQLTEITPGGYAGRIRASVRLSTEGHKVGFAGTLLDGGWVTVEVSQELPHANTVGAQAQAQAAAFNLAVDGLEVGLQMLLAKVSEPDETNALLDAFLDNPGIATSKGVAEPIVRALQAAPVAVWQSFTPDEQEELRSCYQKST